MEENRIDPELMEQIQKVKTPEELIEFAQKVGLNLATEPLLTYFQKLCDESEHTDPNEKWILVVDDDTTNLKAANTILGSAGMRVSGAKSGEQAVRFLQSNKPDLILLDIHMPEMDGFETLAAIRQNQNAENASENDSIPVIFLTADDDSEAETKGLKAGAMDFIRKPFIPDVLLLRVNHAIELTRLQADLEHEVDRKTQEVLVQNRKLERMSIQIVMALAEAIDLKSAYTNGHSSRVAEYSRTIAKQAGFTPEMQKEIHMAALMHDVGKIGIPDAIINKEGKLNDEEYEIIKSHPVLGEKILRKIPESPELLMGARYHHERYDGRGYPEGLVGEEIPIEGRIIAVADAYDAMSSRRSYRAALPQAQIRAEIEEGRGTQFDPLFADIMLAMIDADTDYQMREK